MSIDLDRLTEIPGFDGYAADDDGCIWSVASNWRGLGPRKIVPNPDPDGYLKARVYRNGSRVCVAVHKLVALAFHGLPITGQQVRHLDGDKTNNRPVNLWWGTAKDNADDRATHGRSPKGERHGCAKLTNGEVRLIRQQRREGVPVKELAKRFLVGKANIQMIINRSTWKHVD